VIGATTPRLISDLNITPSETGLLYSSAFIISPVLVFATGVGFDRYGTNVLGSMLCVCLVVGQTLIAFTMRYTGILAGRIVFGFGFEPMELLQEALFSKWLGDDPPVSLNLAFGISFTFCELGTLLAFWFLPTIDSKSGLKVTLRYVWFVMLGAGAMYVLVVVLGVFAQKNQDVLDQREKEERAAREAAKAEAAAQAKLLHREGSNNNEEDDSSSEASSEAEEPISFSVVKQLPAQLWLTSFIATAGYSSILCFETFLVDYLHDEYGLSTVVAGRYCATLSLYPIFLSPLCGYFLTGAAPHWYIVTMACGCACALLGHITQFYFYTEINPLLPMIGYSLSYTVVPIAAYGFLPEIIPERILNSAFGACVSLMGIGMFIFPPICGKIRVVTGSYRFVNIFFALVCLLGLVACVWAMIIQTGLQTKGEDEALKELKASQDEFFHKYRRRPRGAFVQPPASHAIPTSRRIRPTLAIAIRDSQQEGGPDDHQGIDVHASFPGAWNPPPPRNSQSLGEQSATISHPKPPRRPAPRAPFETPFLAYTVQGLAASTGSSAPSEPSLHPLTPHVFTRQKHSTNKLARSKSTVTAASLPGPSSSSTPAATAAAAAAAAESPQLPPSILDPNFDDDKAQ
jgi:hypothetical protein